MRFFKALLGIFLLLIGITMALGTVAAFATLSEQPGGAVCPGVFSVLLFYISFRLLQSKKPDWRNLPPTEKQIDYAEDLGIDFNPDRITRGQLSDMISKVTGSG